MPMQLILTRDVPHLGKAGELVTVKSGYGRNYLVPQGMAVTATSSNVHNLEQKRKQIEARVSKDRAGANALAEKLGGITLQITKKVGEGDRMYGSVTSRDLARQLEVAGIKVDSRNIRLDEPVREIGKHEVEVRCGADVIATLKFWVTAEPE